MKHLMSVLCILGGLCAGAPAPATAQSIDAPGSSASVRMLAERLQPAGARAPIGEEQIGALCADVTDAGDVLEATLLAGLDVFSAVKETILACGRQGNGAEVTRQAATRALQLRGESVRYLIDGAVIAAASEIARRLTGGAPAAPDQRQARRDLERERLERMMQKGLIDDEYRRYIDERRALVESPASPAGYDYGDFFLQPLPVYDPPFNPGGIMAGPPIETKVPDTLTTPASMSSQ